MRSDQWAQSGAPKLFINDGGIVRSNSLSGKERNRLKLSRAGNFVDASLVSGADFKTDGRGFVLLDFDKDGWLDIGLVSANAPRLRILKNNLGRVHAEGKMPQKAVTLQLMGGNDTSDPSGEWSSRDAFGAKVMVTTAANTRAFLHSFSGGLSCQNTNSVHIGMGSEAEITKLEILWPSGKSTVRENVAAGSKLKILENEPNTE